MMCEKRAFHPRGEIVYPSKSQLFSPREDIYQDIKY
jgi:hypothetical protein